MKALIDVERKTWGKVKNFATVNRLSLNNAVEQLLQSGLKQEEKN
jgi:hypothetical protein